MTLTDRQRQVLTVIYRSLLKTGKAPTYSEFRETLGVSSNNAINDHLEALESKGVICRYCTNLERDHVGRWSYREIGITKVGVEAVLVSHRIAALEGMVDTLRDALDNAIAVIEGTGTPYGTDPER